jgi:Arm DNA-binding domain
MIKKHTFSLLPVVRGKKKGGDDLVAIYLRITVDGVVKELSTKTFVQASKWNPVKGRVNGTTEDSRILNGTIQSFEHRAREVYNRCIESGKLVTADLIKDEVLGVTHKSHTLVDQFDLYLRMLGADTIFCCAQKSTNRFAEISISVISISSANIFID